MFVTTFFKPLVCLNLCLTDVKELISISAASVRSYGKTSSVVFIFAMTSLCSGGGEVPCAGPEKAHTSQESYAFLRTQGLK